MGLHLIDAPRTAARSLALAAALTLAAAGPSAAQQGQQGQQAGVSAAVDGRVLLARAEAVGRQVESGEAIFLGDFITAGADSRLQVLLLDESVFTLGPESRIEIDRFIFDPDAQGGSMVVNLTRGALRFVAGKVASGDPNDMQIVTPVGQIGIRGTIGLVSVLTSQQAQQQFPDQAPQGGAPGQPVVFAALVGPGPTSQGQNTGSFNFSSPNGSVDLNRPGGAVLATPGQPPVFFIAPPGAINDLGLQSGGGQGQAGGQGSAGGEGQGGGVNVQQTQQTGGSSQPTPIGTLISGLDQTLGAGDAGEDAVDPTVSGSAASVGVTLQELVAANSGSAGGSADLTGGITGEFSYFLDFAERTFDLQASNLNGGGLTNASILLENNSASLPADARRTLSVGNNGEDFPATTTNCDACTLSATFPDTGTIAGSVTHRGATGATGNVPLDFEQ
ncbi:MAG: FecR family protein [Alphaproteobacteria bacterium]|nr:FecR family protein [Alphaproteobacteria bacterium]